MSSYQRYLSILSGLVLALGFAASVPAANPVYVDDTLRVGVRPEPGSGGGAISVVTSGTELEVLESSEGYSRVRTPNGVEGWVKSAYLSRQRPAILKLRDREQELARLQKRLASGDRANPADRQELDALRQRLAELEQANINLQAQANNNGGDLMNLTRRDGRGLLDSATVYWLAALIFFLSVGFLGGVFWNRHQVSKRLGGFTL